MEKLIVKFSFRKGGLINYLKSASMTGTIYIEDELSKEEEKKIEKDIQERINDLFRKEIVLKHSNSKQLKGGKII